MTSRLAHEGILRDHATRAQAAAAPNLTSAQSMKLARRAGELFGPLGDWLELGSCSAAVAVRKYGRWEESAVRSSDTSAAELTALICCASFRDRSPCQSSESAAKRWSWASQPLAYGVRAPISFVLWPFDNSMNAKLKPGSATGIQWCPFRRTATEGLDLPKFAPALRLRARAMLTRRPHRSPGWGNPPLRRERALRS